MAASLSRDSTVVIQAATFEARFTLDASRVASNHEFSGAASSFATLRPLTCVCDATRDVTLQQQLFECCGESVVSHRTRHAVPRVTASFDSNVDAAHDAPGVDPHDGRVVTLTTEERHNCVLFCFLLGTVTECSCPLPLCRALSFRRLSKMASTERAVCSGPAELTWRHAGTHYIIARCLYYRPPTHPTHNQSRPVLVARRVFLASFGLSCGRHDVVAQERW